MMMIDGINGGGGPPRAAPGPRAATTPAAGATPAASNGEPARPVARAAPVARNGAGALVAELASAPPVNRARVDELRAAIAAGRYAIDPAAIADAMLRLERGQP